ncbi:MAG: hypothetical protein EPO28_03320 [Saprospiraceae bacterium]|nr:MAG: hypothetical protein EPO28_03320 [Saprospiraceae bacterium]
MQQQQQPLVVTWLEPNFSGIISNRILLNYFLQRGWSECSSLFFSALLGSRNRRLPGVCFENRKDGSNHLPPACITFYLVLVAVPDAGKTARSNRTRAIQASNNVDALFSLLSWEAGQNKNGYTLQVQGAPKGIAYL